MDLSLERTLEVKQRLGIDFEVPVIVVAGTNGKGSTCAMLEAIARSAGWRTGLYQKPEFVHFEERCRVDGLPVAAQTLLPHFEAVEAARGDITLTKFEFTTLAIAHCLAHQEVDVVILEVGLGWSIRCGQCVRRRLRRHHQHRHRSRRVPRSLPRIDRAREGGHPAHGNAGRSSATRRRRAACWTRPNVSVRTVGHG